jgi:hypothetical protein
MCHSRRSGRLRDSRWSRWPRTSSSEVVKSPEAKLSVGRDGDCALGRNQRRARQRFAPEGQFYFTCRIRCPIGGWQASCVYSIREPNYVVVPGYDRCLVRHYAPVPLCGVGMCIKCECSTLVFGHLCLICLGSARARRMERW